MTAQTPTAIAARNTLSPISVDLNKVPGWIAKQLRPQLKQRGETLYAPSASEIFSCFRRLSGHGICGGLWDHWGTASSEAGPVFVAEPYGPIGPDLLIEICEFAHMVNADWQISANSHWSPGRTVRVEFRQRVEAAHE